MNGPSKNSKRLQVVAAIVVAFVAATTIDAAEPLRWKFTPGETLRYCTTAERDTTIDLGPAGEESRRITHVVDMTWTVQHVNDDGSAVLTQKIDRLQLKLTAPKEEDVVLDSADPAEPKGFAAMAAPLVRALLAGDVKITMTPRGEITAVEAPEALLTALENSVGKDVIGDLATKRGFENLARSVSLQLPEKLDDGETWTAKLETVSPLIGKIVAETTYKYDGPREVDGQTLEAFAPSLAMQFKDSAATIEVSDEKTSGEILFNRTAGRLESGRLEHAMKLAIESEGNDLQQKITQKVETKWLDQKAP